MEAFSHFCSPSHRSLHSKPLSKLPVEIPLMFQRTAQKAHLPGPCDQSDFSLLHSFLFPLTLIKHSSNMSYLSVFLIHIDILIYVQRKKGNKEGIGLLLSIEKQCWWISKLISISILPSQDKWSVLKKGKENLRKGDVKPPLSAESWQPWALEVQGPEITLRGTERAHSREARRLEIRKCVTKFMKGIWGGFCHPSYGFMVISSKFLSGH